jgi:alpha-ketoglutarate-dependent taurine dioxygenase
MQELVMTYQKIEVERRSPHLGAFLEAVDLSSPLDVATVKEIRAALLGVRAHLFP